MTTVTEEFQFLPQDAALVSRSAHLPHVRRKNATVGGLNISTLHWTNEPPQYTFLHGAGLNAHTWDATILGLNRPALAVDLPGHGDSDWREDADYRPITNAAAIGGVLDQLTSGPQILVGQSLGGLSAIAAAHRQPQQVRSLVLVDITPGVQIDPKAPNPVKDFLAGPRQYPSREAIVERALTFGFGPDREAVARGVYLNTRVTPDGQVEFKHHLAHLDLFKLPTHDPLDLWASLQDLTIPVALVYGTQGFLNSSHLTEFQRYLPDAALYPIKGGHNLQEDTPSALTQALKDIERSAL
ncbi:alpha/beta fold hydrolase [Deinococcus hopiensis]|uniref:Pimeloyl-ACP methyl ester carboxylesterase n=1 Tax=Deinococcus hopiensis KR-140 TaxID=695939 RepID=A0A1W1UX45_9DEIO|nr:alpha/beta hydrolase [Deinococcus hopiensis]SMB85274.1 Pimeloyl-ACP methyl ester carboxylesterase [Deinococcus hopiensis KR-140]